MRDDKTHFFGCVRCGLDADFVGPYRPAKLYDGSLCTEHVFGWMRRSHDMRPSLYELLFGPPLVGQGR